MAFLTKGTVSSVVCRARPVPYDAYVAGEDGGGNPVSLTLVTNDERMIGILLSALVQKKQVELDYGDPIEYFWDESATPPVTLVGNLLQRITLTP
jgi:hypothetical protein